MKKKYTDIDIISAVFGCILAIMIFNAFKSEPEYAKRDFHLTKKQVMVIWGKGYMDGWDAMGNTTLDILDAKLNNENYDGSTNKTFTPNYVRDSIAMDEFITIK